MKKIKSEYIFLGIIVIIAFLIRVIPQWGEVFQWGTVVFRGTDPWYHMRIAEWTAINFPKPMLFDTFLVYPNGSQIGFTPLLGWIVAAISKLGININYVGAFLPPIFGAFTSIGVYLLGKELWGKPVGFMGAIFVALLPGEFLHRSLLGTTDHHVLETLFFVLTLAFLIISLRRQRLLYAVLAGISLGLYQMSWQGNLLFMSILFACFFTQFLIMYLRNKPIAFLCKSFSLTLIVSYIVASPIIILMETPMTYLVAYLGFLLVPLYLWFLSSKIKTKGNFYLVSVWSLVIAILLLAFMHRDLYYFVEASIRASFFGFGSPIEEAIPTDWATAWGSYGLTLFMAMGGIYFIFKKKNVNILFLVWSLLVVLLMFGQRRWNYYGVVPVALLSGIFIYEISQFIRKDTRIGAIIIIVFFTLMVSIRGIIGVATLPNTITKDWYDTLTWIRYNTPEQFVSGDFYYGDGYEKPNYGVLSWWDYGHWIIRISHRVPTSNPANWGSYGAYRFLTAQTTEEAEKHIKDLNVKYIIVDVDIIWLPGQYTSKFPAICSTVGLKGDWRQYLENSMAYRLFTQEVDGYKQVFAEGKIKVFEKVD